MTREAKARDAEALAKRLAGKAAAARRRLDEYDHRLCREVRRSSALFGACLVSAYFLAEISRCLRPLF